MKRPHRPPIQKGIFLGVPVCAHHSRSCPERRGSGACLPHRGPSGAAFWLRSQRICRGSSNGPWTEGGPEGGPVSNLRTEGPALRFSLGMQEGHVWKSKLAPELPRPLSWCRRSLRARRLIALLTLARPPHPFSLYLLLLSPHLSICSLYFHTRSFSPSFFPPTSPPSFSSSLFFK